MLLRYARPEDNLLAGGCQLTLIFCFIGAGYIWVFEQFSELLPPAAVSEILVFASTAVIALPLVVVTLAMIVVMVVIMVLLIYKEGHQPIILLASTGAPPLLTFGEGQKWQLFLSHLWSTGQE